MRISSGRNCERARKNINDGFVSRYYDCRFLVCMYVSFFSSNDNMYVNACVHFCDYCFTRMILETNCFANYEYINFFGNALLFEYIATVKI